MHAKKEIKQKMWATEKITFTIGASCGLPLKTWESWGLGLIKELGQTWMWSGFGAVRVVRAPILHKVLSSCDSVRERERGGRLNSERRNARLERVWWFSWTRMKNINASLGAPPLPNHELSVINPVLNHSNQAWNVEKTKWCSLFFFFLRRKWCFSIVRI
jgi:hypothetical protein